ncbi:hypothetical protein PENTCL1PPCAC_17200, partial [Pristionchus entomophagus]
PFPLAESCIREGLSFLSPVQSPHTTVMCYMEFSAIYNELSKLTCDNYNSGNLDALLSQYDEHAVILDRTSGKVGYGEEQIRALLMEDMGKLEFKPTDKEIIPLAGDRFYTNCQYENTIRSTGVIVRGSFQEIWAKRGDEWKVIFVTYDQRA